MDEQALSNMIKEAVRDAIAEERRNLWVEPEQHFLDHDMLRQCRENSDEWRRNHEFIASMREGASIMKKTSWRLAGGAVITFLAASAWLAFKQAIEK